MQYIIVYIKLQLVRKSIALNEAALLNFDTPSSLAVCVILTFCDILILKFFHEPLKIASYKIICCEQTIS